MTSIYLFCYIILNLYIRLAIAQESVNQTVEQCLVPNGDIILMDLKTRMLLEPGTFVPQFTNIEYSCPEKFYLESDVKANICYTDWVFPQPKCQKVCPPIQGHTIVAFCENKGITVDCNKNVPGGTTAKIVCAPMYKKPKSHLLYENLLCLNNGEWDYAPFKCEQICGTIDTKVPFILNGSLTQPTTVPWHVGIYRKVNNENYEHVCGGTIIESNFIISAANCFWNDNMLALHDASNYIIAVGKFYRDFYTNNETFKIQTVNISRIDVPITFRGAIYDYLGNIALLTLNEHIRYTSNVRPACRNDQIVTNNVKGVFAGWGITSSGTSSSRLLSAELSPIDHSTCELEARYNRLDLTYDKFCLNTSNTANVCRGDLGGGFVVPIEINGITTYYINGLLSNSIIRGNKDICDSNAISAFTNIHYYNDFIDDIIAKTTSSVDTKKTNAVNKTSECLVPPRNLLLVDSTTKNQLKPGTMLPTSTSVHYYCPEKYILEGSINNFCDGEWEKPHPVCIKTCPPIRGHTINSYCSYRGKRVDCTKHVKVGTSAFISCAMMYRKPTHRVLYEDILCQRNGEWDNEPFQCEQICGTIGSNSSAVISSKLIQLNKVPWHVGIYYKQNEGRYSQICGGTIIHSKVIISAAHCFYNDVGRMRYNLSNYIVVAGKTFRDYYFGNETYGTQALNISTILVPKSFRGERYEYLSDIAVLTLSNHIEFKDHVRPACLMWEYDNNQIIYNHSGIAAGWGGTNMSETSPYLRVVEGFEVEPFKCKTQFSDRPLDMSHDKFCLISTTENNICRGDGGGGFVVGKILHAKTIYYLHGVLSNVVLLNPVDDACDSNVIPICTNVLFYKLLIQNEIRKVVEESDLETTGMTTNREWESSSGTVAEVTNSSSLSCSVPDGNIILTEMVSKHKLEAGKIVSVGTSVEYSCPKKYTRIGSGNNVCNGNWTNAHPKCKKICPSIDNRTIKARCYHEGNQVDCGNPIEPGTVAKIRCSTMYAKPKHRLVHEDIYCQSDGEWDHEPFKCEQICGKINTNFPFSLNSKITEPNNVPWHVAIYKEDNSGVFKYICGGTLIHSRIVISAAHCFWDLSESKIYDKSKFIVATGKFYSDFYAYETLEVQKIGVSKIDVPVAFSGSDYDFVSDIAVLTLSNHVRYRNHVSPACLIWKELSDQYIQSNLTGVVAGWGIIDTGKYSPELRSVELLSIDNYICKTQKITKHDKLAVDKFCVETSSGKNVCPGDSGGGFVVSEIIDNITYYHLWGVVSNGIFHGSLPECNADFTASFTNVQFYKDLIINAISKAY